MHWSDKIAREIVDKSPGKKLYTVASGISPSGAVHIGNFRDIATSYFVALALSRLGKKVRFIFSWDEYDRFRKVPKNIEEQFPEFYKFIGLPYSSVPDPFNCHASYAAHYEKQFEESLARFGIEVQFIYQTSRYTSGAYAELVVHALLNRHKIYDIIMDFKTQKADSEARKNYYPINIFCPKCGYDSTTIHSLSADGRVAEYSCKCGHKGAYDFTKEFTCKLVWKVDWPMRWKYESVDFEPGGKDHACVGGSFDVSSVIAEKIFGIKAPFFQGYEFIGIKGSVGKMSGSSGLNMVPSTLLSVYQPEVILWLYSRCEPNRAFDFCFDEEILRQYHEFDRMLDAYRGGSANELERDIMSNCEIAGRQVSTVSMQNLVSFGPIVNWSEQTLAKLLTKIGLPYTASEFRERLQLAKNWLTACSPESLIELSSAPNKTYYSSLSDNEKKCVALLRDELKDGSYSLDETRDLLYAIVTKVHGQIDIKEKKALQARFFEIIYNLLINRSKGPRLYVFLMALDKEKYLPLLSDF